MKKERFDQLILLMQRFCDYKERSSWDVRAKLQKQRVSIHDINTIVEQLKADNYLDDRRYAIQFAQGKNKYNKWGKNKIKTTLLSKKFDHETISIALDSIDPEDYLQILEGVYLAKYNALRETNAYTRKNKTIKHCLNKGFEYELIREFSEKEHR